MIKLYRYKLPNARLSFHCHPQTESHAGWCLSQAACDLAETIKGRFVKTKAPQTDSLQALGLHRAIMEIATTIAADVQGMLLRDDGEEDLTIDHFGLTIRDPPHHAGVS